MAVIKRLPMLRSLKLTWARKADAVLAAEEWRWMMRELQGLRTVVSLRLWPFTDRDLLQLHQPKLLSAMVEDWPRISGSI